MNTDKTALTAEEVLRKHLPPPTNEGEKNDDFNIVKAMKEFSSQQNKEFISELEEFRYASIKDIKKIQELEKERDEYRERYTCNQHTVTNQQGTISELKMEVELLANNLIERNNQVMELKSQLQESQQLNERLAGLLNEYNQWEADIISEDKLWWPNRAQDVLRGPLYDKMLELQSKRNELLSSTKEKGGEG